MKVLIAAINNEITDRLENELYDLFEINKIEKTDDPTAIYSYNNYDLCIIDLKLKSKLEESPINIDKFFVLNKGEIIKSNTIFIFISDSNKSLEIYSHKSFKNILTFKYAKTKSHNFAKLDRFVEIDLKRLVQFKIFLKKKRLLFFVHGFSGNKETWSNLITLINNDLEIKKFKVDYFNYNSFEFNYKKIINKIKIRNFTDINGLANSLKNKISNNNYDELILIGHSLGCLVIKKFLSINYKYQWNMTPNKVILFAPPNKGSRLADPLLLYAFFNPHVQYLSSISIKRRIDNFKWWFNKIENQNNIGVIIGLNDKTVRLKSASFGFKESSLFKIHDVDHIDIKEPGSIDSEIFKTFKRIINN